VDHDESGPTGEAPAHHVAAGGWRRVLAGFLVGAAVGAAIGLILPRDDGPVRPGTRG
jgi:hypothetical protein